MENIQTEQTVVIEVNGVEVDVDVIVKDAELGIEMNNNDAIEKLATPNTTEMPVDEVVNQETTTETPEMPETSETLETPQAPETPEVTVTSQVPETPQVTETPQVPEKPEMPTEKIEQNDEQTTTETAEGSTDTNNGTEHDVSIEPTEGDLKVMPSEASNDDETKDSTIASSTTPASTENTDANETIKSESSKKSPRKKSLKKRKNRSNSQKKEVDYSKYEKYTVSVSQRQRRYYLVGTRGFNVPVPSDDCEIFCTNIPINVLEGELIPLFERYGKIWELRLMMSMRNPKRNAGFAFVRFTTAGAAADATQKLNNYEILPGKLLSVRLSQPNLSLFVGNIHRGLTQEQIHEKLSNKTEGLVKTFVKTSPYEETKNCGFCFLEYDSHSDALKAKRLLKLGNVWGRQLFVDWAQRRKQPDQSDLHDSKTLFINYLPKETTEEQIAEALATFGTIEKITKIKDYAFVLFEEHDQANNAMTGVDKPKLGHENVEISLAMPKSMKSRSRPFHGYMHQRNDRRRRRSFKQFGESNKFYLRNQQKPSTANETATQNGPADAAVEQTTMLSTPLSNN